MKILFVHNFHQKFGGDDTVVLNYVEMLRKAGHTVELYQRHNDEIQSFNLWQKLRFLTDTVFSVRTIQDIRQMIRTFCPDLLFVHGIYPLVSPSVYDAAIQEGVPVVQMVHDMRFWCPMAWFFRSGKICTLCSSGNFLNAVRYRCYRDSLLLSAVYALSIFLMRKRGVFRKISHFIIPSEHIRDYLLKDDVPGEKISLHPHIVPDCGDSSHRPEKKAYAAFLGRLSPEKGVMLLLRAAKHLPQFNFKIAGTGPLEPELRDYIRAERLENIEFYGFLSGDRKKEFLSEASFLVVPSECYESFGQVVVEAYASGTPVIAAGHGGLSSLVKDGETGWVFAPGDEAHLIEVLSNAWNFPNLGKISSNTRKFYEEYLSEPVLLSSLEQTLRSVLKK